MSRSPKGLLFLLLYIVAVSVVTLFLGVRFGGPLLMIEARNIHFLLNLLGVENVLIGTLIYIPSLKLAFQITWQCSGMFSMSLYTVVFLTFPGIRREVFRWLFGLAVIYLANILRIVVAIYLYNAYGEGAFSTFHYTVGPILMFAIVVFLLGDLLYKGLQDRGQKRL